MIVRLLLLFTYLVSYADAGLYNQTDYMAVLNSTNFNEIVLGVRNAWIIEFYNTWCGHCINFAPTWVTFTKEIIDWNHIIKPAVIDCAANDNVPLCREYEVMSYPTIKLFPGNLQHGDRGEVILGRKPDALQNDIINFLVRKQSENKGSDNWVNLLNYEDEVSNVFKDAPTTSESAVVITEKEEHNIARHVILDLGRYPMLYVRRKSVKSARPNRLPSIIYISRDGKQEEMFGSTTRQEISAEIIKHLNLMKKMTDYNIPKPAKSEKTDDELIGAGDGPPPEGESDDDLGSFIETDRNFDHIYMVDIENTIRYAIKHEVILHKTITGERLEALKNFLKVLTKYLPSRQPIHNFLVKLYDHLSNSADSFEGEELHHTMNSLTTDISMLPEHQPWIGCMGSKPQYRGYPCGLWVTFHTLTVNAAIAEKNNKNYDPKHVLSAIHGYVKNFFSCKHCSQHFQLMYSEDAETYTRAVNDEVIWLWKSHNKVNKRLKGDLSEDPDHPKNLFPSSTNCPACYKNNDQFDDKAVLKYLKKIYHRDYLFLEGTQSLTFVRSSASSIHYSFMKSKDERFLYKQNIMDGNGTWGFNSLDINLCVLLYGFSTLIIVCGYFLFVVKKHFRRKKILSSYRL